MKLTPEQKSVIKNLIKLEKPIQTLSGYAGTGKSVVVRHLKEALPDFAVCAFTGKAVMVLKNKGISTAQTIHSLIYEPIYDYQGNVTFALKRSLDQQGIIVDEASMIGDELYEDLKYFNLPIIFVGDHGQLEPVGQDINLMKNPDFKLETIHRNAGEIAHFAEFIRNGFRPAAYQFKNPKNIKFIEKKNAPHYYDQVDQIICAFNKTRNEINLGLREKANKPLDKFVKGDKIMCLRNNRMLGIFNGMQGYVEDWKHPNRILFSTEEERQWLFYDPDQLGQEKYSFSYNKEDPDPFDWCDTISCHKSQGSEWERVLVLEQRCNNWSHVRWAYTAASRASKQLIWASE